MKLIIGLGNPGTEYATTRHNAGFLAVEELANNLGSAWTHDAKRKADIAKGSLGNQTVLVAKPMTYMNNSGEAVQALVSFYKILPGDVLIVHDEMDIEPGRTQLKRAGGAAGHNGVQDVLDRLGTEQVNRLRIGIGKPENAHIPKEDWVLGCLSPEYTPKHLDVVPKMRDWIEEGFETAANRWN